MVERRTEKGTQEKGRTTKKIGGREQSNKLAKTRPTNGATSRAYRTEKPRATQADNDTVYESTTISYSPQSGREENQKEESRNKQTPHSTLPFSYKIVGTSHVASESFTKIEQEILSFKPDLICVELDKGRLMGLMSEKKSSFSPMLVFKLGLFGYLFGLVGHSVQQSIGKKLNIVPGSDMLAAVNLAKKHNIPFVLIDQEVTVTLRNISASFGFREKMRLVGDILSGLFMPRRSAKKMQAELGITQMDLSKVPPDELVEKMIMQLKSRYPGLYKPLVGDRNIYMTDRVVQLFKKYPLKKQLIVVGAGHKGEMDSILKEKIFKLEYVKE